MYGVALVAGGTHRDGEVDVVINHLFLLFIHARKVNAHANSPPPLTRMLSTLIDPNNPVTLKV